MTFFKKVASFGQTVEASVNVESIVKVAGESGISRNDLIVHHNLTQGNVFTGANLVKVAEDEADSVLLVAVSAYEKLASDEINAYQAMAIITDAGLTAEDFNEVADLIDKQASDAAGITADDDVWEKIAEAHDFLSEAGLDPVSSLEFATEFSAAESEYEQDKVASEFDGLDEESIDKIAEAFDFLSDIEGVSMVDLMDEYSKEAGAREMVGRAAAGAREMGGRAAAKIRNAGSVAKNKFNGARRTLDGSTARMSEADLRAAEASAAKLDKKYLGIHAYSKNTRSKAKATVDSKRAVHDSNVSNRNRARIGVAAGGIAATAVGASTYHNGRG
jgi:hypothetical protein